MSDSPVFSSRALLSIPRDGRKTRSVEAFDDRWSGAAVDSVTTGDFTEADDPFQLFALWFKDASAREINDPEAMTLATVDEAGLPDARTLLVQGRRSARPRLLRQRRERQGPGALRQSQGGGPVPLEVAQTPGPLPRAGEPADRRRGRRLFRHAAAAEPNRRLGEPAVPAARIARGPRGGGRSVCEAVRRGRYPAAAAWRGWRLAPLEIEFWQDGAFRLHDRVLFRRAGVEEPWERRRLYP